MVKSKKGKKDVEVEETSDTENVEQEEAAEVSEEEEVDNSKKASKKAKKPKKESAATDEAPKKPEKASSKKGKSKQRAHSDDESEEEMTTATSAFALLGMSDDDGEISEAESEKKVQKKKKPKKKEEPKKAQKVSKPKKDDDDIDAMLAELGIEPVAVTEPKPETVSEEPEVKSKTAKKKKKKGAKGDAVEAAEPCNVEEVVGAQEDPPVSEPQKPVEVKDDKKKKKVEEPAKEIKPVAEAVDNKKKKGPNKAVVAAMQERLKFMREEEERVQREEDERIRILEEADAKRIEAAKLELEKKEKRKLKEQEKKARLKAEGKLLTTKQKADRERAASMLASLKAQGVEVPDVTEKRAARTGTRVRPSKMKKDDRKESLEEEPVKDTTPEKQVIEEKSPSAEDQTEAAPVEIEVEVVAEVIKDAWDESSGDEDSEKQSQKPVAKAPVVKPAEKKAAAPPPVKKQESVEEEASEESSGSSGSESESDDDDEDDSSSDDSDHRTDAEKFRQRAQSRIDKRNADAEKKRSLDYLRAAVVCVLGHVDTGKTKILDKLRRTNVQDGEAGGITQQIGATNVPIDAIKENTKFVKGYHDMPFKLPGLLIIDTPGHESFSNLRSRGSSLCDIAILVVDIMHGLEPQTIESLNLLKQRKTPFVVALNKIDRLYDWQTMPRKDFRDIIKAQNSNTQIEFSKRVNETVVQFAEQGMNAALFYENPDPKSYVSLVPTSAITGEGMGNMLFLICQFCQIQLAKRLMYSEQLQATVLEVKAIPGLGTTIDVILINGKLREGDTMILAGTDGPVTTQIKALLMPQPMKELRVKNAYVEHKEILAAQGVKIAAKELEKAIAGLNMQIAEKADEVEIFREIVAHDLKSVLRSIKLSDHGVFVQASTLGSLEALLEFLKTSKIPYAGIRIGPVVKRDVMKASIMLEHEAQYATILAFDVKIERDAQDLADNLSVKIFQADIIYHLFDKFTAYRDELKQRKREEFKTIAVFPCKLKILPQYIFNSRDPIVMGVIVEAGVVKEGTPICVPSKEFVELGVVTSIEMNHKNVDSARKGQEVCIKIEPIPGDSPKMFGRHFDETDFLVSKITRQSIDACKDYFRDDLVKSDWALMVELKKTFEIL